jgi:wyosine [tRNA(Phe)-imidazoG37] synthetase (radical SAM superfamily)
MDGIIKFRHEVPCAMWLEIFIIQNVNDSRESIFEFVSAIREIKPDKVQLNTLDRPGRVHGLKPAEESVIRKFIDAIEPFCPVDAVGKFTYKSVENTGFSVPATETEKRVTELISRRPCTLEDLCFALSAKPGDIEKLIKHLRNMKKLEARESARGIFYYSK